MLWSNMLEVEVQWGGGPVEEGDEDSGERRRVGLLSGAASGCEPQSVGQLRSIKSPVRDTVVRGDASPPSSALRSCALGFGDWGLEIGVWG